MSVLRRTPTVIRRFLARHPLLYWSIAAIAVALFAGAVAGQSARVDEARDEWGRSRRVWVAAVDHSPGDRVDAEPVEWPTAMIADTAAASVEGAVARQHVGAGEVIDRGDIALAGPLGLVPDGWVALALVESTPVGAEVGARVRLVADGIVLAHHALVVGTDDGRTLVALDEAEVGPVALAAAERSVSLLLVP